jgi:hypothetical protein
MNLLSKVQMFFGKEDLISALERTIELLKKSEDSDWSNLTASEIKEILAREVRKIKNN